MNANAPGIVHVPAANGAKNWGLCLQLPSEAHIHIDDEGDLIKKAR